MGQSRHAAYRRSVAILVHQLSQLSYLILEPTDYFLVLGHLILYILRVLGYICLYILGSVCIL